MYYPEIVREELRAYGENESYALVTIAETDGKTTRRNGKMMVLESGKTIGSIGGGALEMLAVRDAKEAMRSGNVGLREYDLGGHAAETGQACGGKMTVLIEVFGCRPTLVMSGAGHIGKAVIPIAKSVGFRVILVDTRPEEMIAETINKADQFVAVRDYEEGIAKLPVEPGAYFVLAGPNHDCDRAALAGALKKQAAYVGMIGGKKKIQAIFERLRADGFTQEELDFVHTPIGLDISSERPEEIAIAIMAEILMVRNGKKRPAGV